MYVCERVRPDPDKWVSPHLDVSRARSTVNQQIYLSLLGIEALRDMVRLRIHNLTAVLEPSKSTKSATARRARAEHQHDEQVHAYWTCH